jgi:hypothetical protein
MIWGGRLLSENGIFSADNPATHLNMPVSRYLVFLTDGAMAPNTDTYTSYGIENLDQRVTGSSSASGQLNNHKQRFLMTCNAIKNLGIITGRRPQIWVIGFAQALDTSLTDCATDSSKAKNASDKEALVTLFESIGKEIGALRLTQ